MSTSDILTSLTFGLAGGLIGYGQYETIAAACTGAGIGMIAMPVICFVYGLLS